MHRVFDQFLRYINNLFFNTHRGRRKYNLKNCGTFLSKYIMTVINGRSGMVTVQLKTLIIIIF